MSVDVGGAAVHVAFLPARQTARHGYRSCVVLSRRRTHGTVISHRDWRATAAHTHEAAQYAGAPAITKLPILSALMSSLIVSASATRRFRHV